MPSDGVAGNFLLHRRLSRRLRFDHGRARPDSRCALSDGVLRDLLSHWRLPTSVSNDNDFGCRCSRLVNTWVLRAYCRDRQRANRQCEDRPNNEGGPRLQVGVGKTGEPPAKPYAARGNRRQGHLKIIIATALANNELEPGTALSFVPGD